jgi:hypothetical protein
LKNQNEIFKAAVMNEGPHTHIHNQSHLQTQVAKSIPPGSLSN